MEADTPTAPAAAIAERRFRAMGSDAHVVVFGSDRASPASLLDHAIAQIERFEAIWSRFRERSDVQRLNRAAGTGRGVRVDVATIDLLERSVLAIDRTAGAWNPLMGSRLVELGYDRPFADGLVGTVSPAERSAARASDAIDIERVARRARLAEGAALDLGGIAKGHTADVVTASLLDAGAWGAMVNLGGDLRVRGLPPKGIDWVVEVGEPALGRDRITTVRLPSGGVATSTTARRRWAAGDAQCHHLLDPLTSLPARTDTVLTTVVSSEAWWAEVAATAMTVRPDTDLAGCASLQLLADGRQRRRGDFHVYER